MNERLFRTQFNQMETTEKQALMESLATRYDMTFLGLHTFDRWGQNCTTGIFEKDGREFVFVPGDTVTLGWEQFAVGLSQDSREELDYLFQEWEMEQDPEEMIRESMAPIRQAAIGPMLVGRELEELCWEPVTMADPRLTAHPDWLKNFREFAWSDLDSLTMHQSARIERTETGFQICIYNRTDYDALLAGLEKQGLSLPTADEWAYLCGGGCRTLFPWGDGMDYSMHLHHFESPEDEDKPFDMEEPNFFGVSIAYDPYMREVVKAGQFTTCGGDGGRSICGGLGIFLGFLPCSPHYKPEVQEDKNAEGTMRETTPDLTRISKYISLILRHKPEVIGIKLDTHGWADVNALLAGISRKYPINRGILEEIVRSDEKQRYSFSEDGTKIRANQGHSIQVDVELPVTEPPETLYHGTAQRFAASIEVQGLLPRSRLYVHLSPDQETAEKVGRRHGEPVIYLVDAGHMHRDGYLFYLSANGVWLTKVVPATYLKRLEDGLKQA